MKEPKIFNMEFRSVYPLYLSKVVKKGRTEDELLILISWLTGYSKEEIVNRNNDEQHLNNFLIST